MKIRALFRTNEPKSVQKDGGETARFAIKRLEWNEALHVRDRVGRFADKPGGPLFKLSGVDVFPKRPTKDKAGKTPRHGVVLSSGGDAFFTPGKRVSYGDVADELGAKDADPALGYGSYRDALEPDGPAPWNRPELSLQGAADDPSPELREGAREHYPEVDVLRYNQRDYDALTGKRLSETGERYKGAASPVAAKSAQIFIFKRAVPIPEKPGKNWIEHVKGKMPNFIKRVAAHIFTGQGRVDDSRAYAGAISQIKKWAAQGNKKAIAALAQWEKLKAQAAAYSAAKKDDKEPEPLSDAALIEAITGEKPTAEDLAYDPGDKVFENFAFEEGEAKKSAEITFRLNESGELVLAGVGAQNDEAELGGTDAA